MAGESGWRTLWPILPGADPVGALGWEVAAAARRIKRVLRDALPEPVAAELDVFVARRLLTTDTDNSRVVIGVAHEAFLSAWPPLAQAIAENVSALRARRSVEHAAAVTLNRSFQSGVSPRCPHPLPVFDAKNPIRSLCRSCEQTSGQGTVRLAERYCLARLVN